MEDSIILSNIYTAASLIIKTNQECFLNSDFLQYLVSKELIFPLSKSVLPKFVQLIICFFLQLMFDIVLDPISDANSFFLLDSDLGSNIESW